MNFDLDVNKANPFTVHSELQIHESPAGGSPELLRRGPSCWTWEPEQPWEK